MPCSLPLWGRVGVGALARQLLQFVENDGTNAVKVSQRLVAPETQDFEPMIAEESIARSVICGAVRML